MRTEREMFALLRGFALSDERIRAMWLNGSRANPDADKDVFMDYDVVCAVTDLAPFVDATDVFLPKRPRPYVPLPQRQSNRYTDAVPPIVRV